MRRTARRLLTLALTAALAATPALVSATPAEAARATTPGALASWGNSSYGLSSVPAGLADRKVVAFAGGETHSVAVTDDGGVVAWGSDFYGIKNVPASLAGRRVVDVAVGWSHALALSDDGVVTGWGVDNGAVTAPASLTGKHVVAIAAGELHSLALTDDGVVTAWGSNQDGQVAVPASLSGQKVVAIAAGMRHSLALTEDGAVVAWGGDNWYGQGTVPADLVGVDVDRIAAGGLTSVVVTAAGDVVAWGFNGNGEATVPASLSGKKVVDLAVGGNHSLALLDDGTIVGWGRTSGGRTVAPAELAGRTITAIAAGRDHSLALSAAAPTLTTGLTDDTTTIKAGEDVDLTLGVTGADFQGAIVRRGAHGSGLIAGSGSHWTMSGLTTPGTYDYVVEAQTDQGMLTTTITVVVTPAAVATLDVTSPATARHGDTVPVTATGADRFGNDTGDETGRITVTSSDPTDTVSATDVTFGSAGPRTLTATHTPTGVTATHAVSVSLHAFTSPPAPGITGVVKVGETLTADTGGVSPTPDSLAYQWLADGHEIAGATDATFTPGAKQVGARISVRVIARLAGYADAAVTSAATAPVAGSAVPSPHIDVAAAKQQLRRGQSTTLTWTSTAADRVTASGAWTGTKPAAGRATVKPALGTSVYRVTATNQAGSATAQVAVTTTRQAARLRVAATGDPVVRGSRTRISVRGLDAREPYTVRVGGAVVARGTAGARGTARPTVMVPWTRPSAGRAVVVTGSEADRTRRDSLAVTTGKLTATAKKAAARASTAQRITVRGLVPGQKVRVTYRGERISAVTARATNSGTYTVRFDVGQRWGTKKVTVRAGDRSAHVRFAVGPRHG